MDDKILSQYKKVFCEIQYGLPVGGVYPAACLLSTSWAALECGPSEINKRFTFLIPYGVHVEQLLARLHREIECPLRRQVLNAKENYDRAKIECIIEQVPQRLFRKNKVPTFTIFLDK